MNKVSVKGWRGFFVDLCGSTTHCWSLTCRSLISSLMNGAALFQKMNTRGSMPNEPMPKKGTRPRKMGSAEGSIAVNAPVAAVYKCWLAFEDYPKFIPAIKRVRKLDKNHFVGWFAFNGKQYEATLEIMLCVPERRLAWRTISNGHTHDHLAAGVVSFASLSDHGTCVTLKLTSNFGGGVSNRVDKYLRNFKRLIEEHRRKSKDV
jgi:uncharacterized membrane protein